MDLDVKEILAKSRINLPQDHPFRQPCSRLSGKRPDGLCNLLMDAFARPDFFVISFMVCLRVFHATYNQTPPCRSAETPSLKDDNLAIMWYEITVMGAY
jgi:hypothetical protein